MKKGLFRKATAFAVAATMLAGISLNGVSSVEAASISEKKARNIAVNDSRARNSDVMAIDIYDNTVRGQDVYTVTFYEQHGSEESRKFTHYKYHVNQDNGTIVARSHRDLTVISPKQAIKKALDKAGVSSSKVKNKDLDYGADDGNLVYNISFSVPVSYYNYSYDVYGDYYVRYFSDGTCDYNFVINAVNGKIIDWDSDEDYYDYYD